MLRLAAASEMMCGREASLLDARHFFNGANMSSEPALLHEHCRFPKSRFADCDLSDSVFDDVSLRHATFENVALTGARFRNVNLSQAAIEDANLEGMTINGVLVRELFRAYESQRGKEG
jgi:uncharacterized protein YjbI with pentapeptide repeats